MMNFVRRLLTSKRTAGPWRKPWEGPIDAVPNTLVTDPETALTVSAWWAAQRLYQTTVGSLPLVTYRRDDRGGRERAKDSPAYRLLKHRPNPAMSRSTFFELAVCDLISFGEFFAQVQTSEAGELLGLYPVRPWNVSRVGVDEDWRKAYEIRTANRLQYLTDAEMVHVMWHTRDGIRGTRLLDYAGESIGLHRQSLTSAGAFLRNAVRPAGYIRLKGRINKETGEAVREYFKKQFGGPENTGGLPILGDDGEYKPFTDVTAEDARLIETLGLSVSDVARWFGLSPLLLGDLSRGTYSNLAADNAAFYQRSIRPLLGKLEEEINAKVFGPDSDLYAEFLVTELLRGDPQTQAAVANMGITAGWLTRAEQREFVNLPYLPGLDQPTLPLNVGTPQPQPTDEGGDHNA